MAPCIDSVGNIIFHRIKCDNKILCRTMRCESVDLNSANATHNERDQMLRFQNPKSFIKAIKLAAISHRITSISKTIFIRLDSFSFVICCCVCANLSNMPITAINHFDQMQERKPIHILYWNMTKLSNFMFLFGNVSWFISFCK